MLNKLIIAASLIVGLSAHAEVSQDNKAQVLKQMSSVYNTVNTMTDAEFSRMIESASVLMQSKGQTQKAQALKALAQVPGARESFAKKVQSHMNSQATNGIYFIIYLLNPDRWCMVGEMECVIPVTVLSIITLDGETASDI